MSTSGAGESSGAARADGRPRLEDLLRQADAEAAARERRPSEPRADRAPRPAPAPDPAPEAEDATARETRAFAARLGEFRRTAVIVPTLDGDLMTAAYGGIRWIYAFSDRPALARFAVTAGWEPPPADGLEFLTVYGARLLDVVIPATGEPTGVALDVADAETGGCVMFPPVLGIVPDEAAVDGENGEALAAAAAASAAGRGQGQAVPGTDTGETA
ncbi:SseB family protein [Streptomyces sp. NPDC053542]|uniref:SseB family protein n=1 Tax=Streptomyces sp. NPDC053542 TaxID=3365710 RepID=UPI0037CE906A